MTAVDAGRAEAESVQGSPAADRPSAMRSAANGPIHLPECSTNETASSLSGERRILLIDRDPVTLVTVSGTLCRAGFSVTTTANVGEAIACARSTPHVVAILDLETATSGALEIARQLQDLGLPFIVLSMHDAPERVQHAVEAGAFGYFLKPVDPVQLVPAVHVASRCFREMSALTSQIERLRKIIDSNYDVGIAVGLLMAQRGLPRRTAYETLRQQARRTRQRLGTVAADVSAGVDRLFEMPVAPPAESTRTTRDAIAADPGAPPRMSQKQG